MGALWNQLTRQHFQLNLDRARTMPNERLTIFTKSQPRTQTTPQIQKLLTHEAIAKTKYWITHTINSNNTPYIRIKKSIIPFASMTPLGHEQMSSTPSRTRSWGRRGGVAHAHGPSQRLHQNRRALPRKQRTESHFYSFPLCSGRELHCLPPKNVK